MRTLNKKHSKSGQFPNVFVLVFVLACLAAILTWVLPTGQYEHQTVDGISTVIPNTYHAVPGNPQGPGQLLRAFVQGFRVQISLIMFIFVLGSATHILMVNGCFHVILKRRVQKSPTQEKLIIFAIMLIMSLTGAFGILGNAVPAMVPVGILLSNLLGFDKTLGFLIIFLGAFSGFNTGWSNVGVLGTAQNIAGLPFNNSIGLRILIHALNFILNYLFVCRYLKKIKQNPENSLNYKTGLNTSDYMGIPAGVKAPPQHPLWKHYLALTLSAAAILLIPFGVHFGNFGLDEKAAVILGLALLLCLLYGYKPNESAMVILEGAKTTFNAAFITGFSACVLIILREGHVLDTLTNYLTANLHNMDAVGGANAMLACNLVFSIFVTSGSAHANNMLPIMIPIADKLGIGREIAVQAFLFGDGLTNCLVPTIGALMSSLMLAEISYWKYLKKIWPLFLVQLVASFVILNLMFLF